MATLNASLKFNYASTYTTGPGIVKTEFQIPEVTKYLMPPYEIEETVRLSYLGCSRLAIVAKEVSGGGEDLTFTIVQYWG